MLTVFSVNRRACGAGWSGPTTSTPLTRRRGWRPGCCWPSYAPPPPHTACGTNTPAEEEQQVRRCPKDPIPGKVQWSHICPCPRPRPGPARLDSGRLGLAQLGSFPALLRLFPDFSNSFPTFPGPFPDPCPTLPRHFPNPSPTLPRLFPDLYPTRSPLSWVAVTRTSPGTNRRADENVEGSVRVYLGICFPIPPVPCLVPNRPVTPCSVPLYLLYTTPPNSAVLLVQLRNTAEGYSLSVPVPNPEKS